MAAASVLYCCCQNSNCNKDCILCENDPEEPLGQHLIDMWQGKTLPELRIVFNTPAGEEVLFVFTERPLGMNFKRAKVSAKNDGSRGKGIGAKVTRATLPPAAGHITKGILILKCVVIV